MMPLIEKYIKYLRYEKNYSLHTEISYSNDLRQFHDFIESHFSDVEIKSIDSDIIRMWIVSLMEEKNSPRSVNRKLSTLKSFFKYLLRIGKATTNPAKKIVGPKTSKPIPVFVNDKDIEKILDEDTPDDLEHIRNKIITELFYTTGIRRAELIGLKNTDIDFYSKTILVIGKRNKQRIIPLSDDMIDSLHTYLEIRDKSTSDQSGHLFIRENGQPLYPMLAHRIISEKLGQITTLSKTSPHILRHTFATSMLNNGADINAVKELLGHSSLAATEIYTHTSFEELKKIYNKAHPRA